MGEHSSSHLPISTSFAIPALHSLPSLRTFRPVNCAVLLRFPSRTQKITTYMPKKASPTSKAAKKTTIAAQKGRARSWQHYSEEKGVGGTYLMNHSLVNAVHSLKQFSGWLKQ